MQNTVRGMYGRMNGSESGQSTVHDLRTVWGHSELCGPRARWIYEHIESEKLRTTPQLRFLAPK